MLVRSPGRRRRAMRVARAGRRGALLVLGDLVRSASTPSCAARSSTVVAVGADRGARGRRAAASVKRRAVERPVRVPRQDLLRHVPVALAGDPRRASSCCGLSSRRDGRRRVPVATGPRVAELPAARAAVRESQVPRPAPRRGHRSRAGDQRRVRRGSSCRDHRPRAASSAATPVADRAASPRYPPGSTSAGRTSRVSDRRRAASTHRPRSAPWCTATVAHVLLMGDSNAEMMIPAFTKIAREEQDLTLSLAVTEGCRWQRDLYYWTKAVQDTCRRNKTDALRPGDPRAETRPHRARQRARGQPDEPIATRLTTRPRPAPPHHDRIATRARGSGPRHPDHRAHARTGGQHQSARLPRPRRRSRRAGTSPRPNPPRSSRSNVGARVTAITSGRPTSTGSCVPSCRSVTRSSTGSSSSGTARTSPSGSRSRWPETSPRTLKDNGLIDR